MKNRGRSGEWLDEEVECCPCHLSILQWDPPVADAVGCEVGPAWPPRGWPGEPLFFRLLVEIQPMSVPRDPVAPNSDLFRREQLV